MKHSIKLKMLPRHKYRGVNDCDPIRYYYWPVFGSMYRKRVELALEQCTGGMRVLEIGFGTGLAFLNLSEMYQELHGVDLTVNIPEVKSVYDELGIQTHLKQGDILELSYPDGHFDTVLVVSTLEHLKPRELEQAFSEIYRVLKPGGQMVYGTPVERHFMVFMFKILGHDIRKEHFSTEKEIAKAAHRVFQEGKVLQMKSTPPMFGVVYEVGDFIKKTSI